MSIGWLLFGFGGLLCGMNSYLSFVRGVLFLARGGCREDYRHISGFPLIGSLLVALAWAVWIRPQESTALDLVAALLVLIDTGGLHWFAVVMLVAWLRRDPDEPFGPGAG